jgi:cobalt/nickel transport system ATP-binding protein
MNTPVPALELRNLFYRYPDGREALRGVSLEVEQGSSVGVIGPNGAGKSTLLLHLNGILPDRLTGDPTVYVNGQPMNGSSLAEIRRRVGVLFQDPDDQLFCPTVAEDVGFGPKQLGLAEADLEARMADALAKVGLSGSEQRAPHHLSQGEKRRVCLAGVLACDPSILVLDEPTSDLDPRGRRELMALLRTLPVTKIIATHDLEFVVQMCDRVVVLDRGEIVADGHPGEILNNEPLMLRHGLERPHILQHQHPHGPGWAVRSYTPTQ